MDEQAITNIFMNEIDQYPVLSIVKTNQLLKDYKENGSEEAYQKLIIHNLGLAKTVAKKYQSQCQTMNYLDLVQESVLIMMKAIRLYDMNSEAKLSTYITRSLKKTLPVKICKYDANIKVSYQIKIAEIKYNNYVKQYQKETGRIPSRQEIQQETKLSDYYMKAVEQLSQLKPKSLDETCVDKTKKENYMNLLKVKKGMMRNIYKSKIERFC